MEFGVLQFFSWPERRVPITTVYQRALERVKIMDQNGYDAVWLAEHHFSGYSVCPSVHMMGMHIAGMTENMRIGTGVSLAAFYDPLRLAEEVALLDILSGGRVNWGAGRGFDPKEFAAFDIDPAESYDRFRENVDIVLAAWRNEKLNYDGRFHQYSDVEVLPKPFQDPHPPVWMAASSPSSVEWAATQGFSIMMDPHSAHPDLGTKFNMYEETLRSNGFDPSNRDTPMARLIAIDESDRKAEEIARNGARWMLGSYVKGNKQTSRKDPGHTMAADAADPEQNYVDNVIVHGSPERVADKLRELKETIGLNYMLANPLSHSTFLQFTDKVIPALS